MTAVERDGAAEVQNSGGVTAAKGHGLLTLAIEHTLTHYSLHTREPLRRSAEWKFIGHNSSLEESALGVLDVTVSACGPSVFTMRNRAFCKFWGDVLL